jgi:hypothetical protein
MPCVSVVKKGETMPVIHRIAFYQNRRDEIPNVLLGRELAETEDLEGLAEVAAHLHDPNANIASDCLKVLYEAGYLRPELVAIYVDDFLALLRHRNNRLVWGSMIALGLIAPRQAERLFDQRALIFETMANGSVITMDNGIQVLATVAAHSAEYNRELFPFLLKHLRTCRDKEVAQHGERISMAVNDTNRADFIAVLTARLPGLTDAQAARVRKIIRNASFF